MKLVLEIVEDGKRSHFMDLVARSYVIGRDLTTDIPLANDAFSRRHAIFLPFTSGWVIVDLHSTNGSWINGTKLAGGIPASIKDGDFLQFADMAFKVHCYSKELPTLPSGFRLFALRGESETVELDPASFDGSIVTEFGISFELKDGGLYVEFEDPSALVLRNGVRLSDNTLVNAGDVIVCGDFQFLVVFGKLAVAEGERNKQVSGVERAKVVTDLVGGESEASVQRATVFGPNQTTLIDPERYAKLRFGSTNNDDSNPAEEVAFGRPVASVKSTSFSLSDIVIFFEDLNDTERRLLYGIIFFIGASLFLFLSWFLFLR
jgi:hypothetical protein